MNDSIEIFQSNDGSVSLEIVTDGETIWVSPAQIEQLFGIDQSRVSRHLQAVFRDEEVDRVTNMRKAHKSNLGRPLTVYSLDAVLAVGYRTRSARAIEFRRWATTVLRKYVLDGVAINESRLRELGQVVSILSRSVDELVSGSANIVADYLPGLVLLRDYDEGTVESAPKSVPGWQLTLAEARDTIAQVRENFPADNLFGGERGDKLAGIVDAIYQGFGGQQIYPTVEEKAANLLYLVVKDHPLSDGNKRSAAALFVTFLARNGILADAAGNLRIANNTLAAVTLLVAMSDPKEKDLMVALLVRMLTEGDA